MNSHIISVMVYIVWVLRPQHLFFWWFYVSKRLVPTLIFPCKFYFRTAVGFLFTDNPLVKFLEPMKYGPSFKVSAMPLILSEEGLKIKAIVYREVHTIICELKGYTSAIPEP